MEACFQRFGSLKLWSRNVLRRIIHLVGLVCLNVVHVVKPRKRFVPFFKSPNSLCEFGECGEAAPCLRCKTMGKPCGGGVFSQEARSVDANNEKRSDDRKCVLDAGNPCRVQRHFSTLKKSPLTVSEGVPLKGRRNLTVLDLGRTLTSINVRTIMEEAVNILQAEFRFADSDTIASVVRDTLLLCGLECNPREASPAPTSSTIPRSPSPESHLHSLDFSHKYPYF